MSEYPADVEATTTALRNAHVKLLEMHLELLWGCLAPVKLPAELVKLVAQFSLPCAEDVRVVSVQGPPPIEGILSALLLRF